MVFMANGKMSRKQGLAQPVVNGLQTTPSHSILHRESCASSTSHFNSFVAEKVARLSKTAPKSYCERSLPGENKKVKFVYPEEALKLAYVVGLTLFTETVNYFCCS